MASPFLAEIRIFAGNFAPRNYAFCNGQLLAISQNTALFSLLGTTYGGNGITTFALPDFQGRAPMNWGQGPGLQNYDLGQSGGQDNVTLAATELPLHNHLLNAENSAAASNLPTGNFLAQGGENVYAAPNNLVAMNPGAVSVTGGGQPHNNMQPYLAVSFIIALAGTFPSR
jgi:microcystin-dependent protein